MNRYGIAIWLMFSLLACRMILPSATQSSDLQVTLDELATLTHGIGIPEHLQDPNAERTGKEFDVNEYFSVLTHLSPESGYTLDYVYYYEFMGSEPIIYARQEQEEPYATFSQYREAIGEDTFRESRLEYLEHIESDGSAEGYFEWAVLAVQGGQFYLGWHSNYNDVTVLCSREAVKKVIERASELGIPMTPAQERKALKLDLEPLVDFEEETVRVQIVTFTKWGGFFRRIFVINRDFPHNIIQHESVELVSYDCGVQF